MNGTPWTNDQLTILKEKYADTSTEKIAFEIGRGIKSVYSKAKELEIKKSKEFLSSEQSGRLRKGHGSKIGQFPKGHKSWNTGMKGYCAPGSEKGHFQKGSKPHNTKFDGAITLRTDKTGRKYYWIRVENAKWEMLHVWMYKRYIGEVPDGFVVVFCDKNSERCELKNLEMISRAEHAIRNQNRVKQAISQKKYHAGGVSDKHIAAYLSYRSPELKDEILKNTELLEIKRAQLKLKRLIKNGRK